jgi:hypothetical protein
MEHVGAAFLKSVEISFEGVRLEVGWPSRTSFATFAILRKYIIKGCLRPYFELSGGLKLSIDPRRWQAIIRLLV